MKVTLFVCIMVLKSTHIFQQDRDQKSSAHMCLLYKCFHSYPLYLISYDGFFVAFFTFSTQSCRAFVLIGRDTLDSGYTGCRVRGGLFSCLEVMRGIFCYLPPPTLAITRCTLGLMWRGYSRETLKCDIDELWTSPVLHHFSLPRAVLQIKCAPTFFQNLLPKKYVLHCQLPDSMVKESKWGRQKTSSDQNRIAAV